MIDDLRALHSELHTIAHGASDIAHVIKEFNSERDKVYKSFHESIDKKVQAVLLAEQNIKNILDGINHNLKKGGGND